MKKIIEKIFKDDAEKIKVLIISRLIYQLPLKRINSWYERTYLSKMNLNLSS